VRVQPPSWLCACPYGLVGCGLAPVQLFPPLRRAARALAALAPAAQRRSWHSLLPVSGQQHMPPLNNIDAGSISTVYLQCPVLSDGDAVLLVSAPASQSGSFVWRSAGGHSQPRLSAARQLGGLLPVQHQAAMLSMLHIRSAKTAGFCSAAFALLGFTGLL
jgi:hypothetical protein